MRKYFHHTMVISFACIVIGALILAALSATMGPTASQAAASHLMKKKYGHYLRLAPPRLQRIGTRPLGLPINPPKPIKPPTKRGGLAITATSMIPLSTTGTTAPSACTATTIDLKVLVLASDGNEADLPAIKQALDYLGTPYTVYIAAQTPNGLTPDKLSNGCHGFYQGVILTNGYLVYYNGSAYVSALSQQEWTNLWTYEATMGVREVSWYTYPNADFGFQAPNAGVDTSTSPLAIKLTAQGAPAFPYLNAATTINIQNAWTYLAQPLTDGTTTTLLSDANGNALVAVHTTPDQRQVLSQTFDSNPNLIHAMVLSYGLINWVTKGVFLGERHVYMSAQVDDLFINDNVWPPSTPCGTDVEQTNAFYRITSADLQAAINWQTAKRTASVSANTTLTMAFNGFGTTAAAGYSPDTLTPAAQQNQAQFYWISHTYDHADLTSVSYNTADSEIYKNSDVGWKTLNLTNFSDLIMVTPNVSGLTNPNFLQAAFDDGIRYLVTDTSVSGYNNPSPNAGIYNTYQPAILMIPRHPTNLFYNVSTPDEWVAEYNCHYASFWGHNLSYQQILDFESQMLLTYMLKGDIDPWMFHQPNLRAYDGTHTLLGDLLDLALQKYAQYYNLPIVNQTMDTIGQTVANRMQYNGAGVTASIIPGVSITITAQKAATVPVTGLKSTGSEVYGGQNISYVSVAAGQSVTLPLT